MSDGFGKYDVYTDFGSRYCYKDSHVLKNRYSIHDADKLKQTEQDIVTLKQQYLMERPIMGRFTPTHLSNIHRFLFGDVYSFAGHYRLETIKKGDTTFLGVNDIPKKLSILLSNLKDEQFLSALTYDAYIDRLAYYIAELNYIHPFREGNGRATREFFRLLIEHNGYSINWTAAGVTSLLDAMILSVYDKSKLCEVLKHCVKRHE